MSSPPSSPHSAPRAPRLTPSPGHAEPCRPPRQGRRAPAWHRGPGAPSQSLFLPRLPPVFFWRGILTQPGNPFSVSRRLLPPDRAPSTPEGLRTDAAERAAAGRGDARALWRHGRFRKSVTGSLHTHTHTGASDRAHHPHVTRPLHRGSEQSSLPSLRASLGDSGADHLPVSLAGLSRKGL